MIVIAIAACTNDPTRVEVHVTESGNWLLDNFQIRIGDRVQLTDPIAKVDITLPDNMVSDAATVEVWGLERGQQVAYGQAMVTPARHATVKASVMLTAIDCGPTCDEGAVECAGDGTSTCELHDDGCLAWSDVTSCPSGQTCTSGACAVSISCTPAMCTTPPAPACVNSTTLRTYAANGTCANNACSYMHTDQTCTNGCAAGACKLLACNCADAVNCCYMIATNQTQKVECDGDQLSCQLGQGDPWAGTDSNYVHQNCPTIQCL
jgi:hypothetical protein